MEPTEYNRIFTFDNRKPFISCHSAYIDEGFFLPFITYFYAWIKKIRPERKSKKMPEMSRFLAWKLCAGSIFTPKMQRKIRVEKHKRCVIYEILHNTRPYVKPTRVWNQTRKYVPRVSVQCLLEKKTFCMFTIMFTRLCIWWVVFSLIFIIPKVAFEHVSVTELKRHK